jgi:hypothetical protein
MDKACDGGRCRALECKAQPAECEGMVQPLAHTVFPIKQHI